MRIDAHAKPWLHHERQNNRHCMVSGFGHDARIQSAVRIRWPIAIHRAPAQVKSGKVHSLSPVPPQIKRNYPNTVNSPCMHGPDSCLVAISFFRRSSRLDSLLSLSPTQWPTLDKKHLQRPCLFCSSSVHRCYLPFLCLRSINNSRCLCKTLYIVYRMPSRLSLRTMNMRRLRPRDGVIGSKWI